MNEKSCITRFNLFKWGAAANIISGVFVAIAYLLHPPTAPPETVGSLFWVLIHAGFMVSLICGIFGLIAMVAHYMQSDGRVAGFIGFAMGLISLVFIFGLDYAEVFIFPTLAHEFPAVIEKYGAGEMMPSVAFAFPITGILFLIGFLLFNYELVRTNALSKPAAIFTMIGVIIFTAGLSGFTPMAVVQIGAAVFGFGLSWLGVSLWSKTASNDKGCLLKEAMG